MPIWSSVIRRIIKFIKCAGEAAYDLIQHDGIEHGGYIAFLIMLGIFPCLVVIAAMVGFMDKLFSSYFGHSILEIVGHVILQSSWAAFITALQPRIIEIIKTPPQSFWTVVIFTAVWSASSIFEGLRTILNRAYRVSKPPRYVLRRFISILEFVATVLFIVIAISFLEVLPYILGTIYQWLPSFVFNTPLQKIQKTFVETKIIRFLLLLFFGFLATSLTYYSLTNTKQRWKDTLPGSITTIFGWWLSSKAFGYYISTFPQINIIYGSIAGFIISLLYFYICSIVFIYGAELNYRCIKIAGTKKV